MIKSIKKILSWRGNSLCKTIYYNFKYLPFKSAIKLPMIVAKNSRITGKGIINLNADNTIYIGQKTLNWMNEKREYTLIHLDGGQICFNGKCYIGLGSKIEVKKYGELIIGENVTFTGKVNVICSKKIVIGDYCLISWDTLLMDSDSHTIYTKNINKNIDEPIIIGNHVWIGCKATILKNTYIANDIVIASNSIVSGNYSDSNVILANNKARKIKDKIEWNIKNPNYS